MSPPELRTLTVWGDRDRDLLAAAGGVLGHGVAGAGGQCDGGGPAGAAHVHAVGNGGEGEADAAAGRADGDARGGSGVRGHITARALRVEAPGQAVHGDLTAVAAESRGDGGGHPHHVVHLAPVVRAARVAEREHSAGEGVHGVRLGVVVVHRLGHLDRGRLRAGVHLDGAAGGVHVERGDAAAHLVRGRRGLRELRRAYAAPAGQQGDPDGRGECGGAAGAGGAGGRGEALRCHVSASFVVAVPVGCRAHVAVTAAQVRSPGPTSAISASAATPPRGRGRRRCGPARRGHRAGWRPLRASSGRQTWGNPTDPEPARVPALTAACPRSLPRRRPARLRRRGAGRSAPTTSGTTSWPSRAAA
jgi:hypothetical protein